MASLDEELDEQQEMDRERAENFAVAQQQELMQRQEEAEQEEAQREAEEALQIQRQRSEDGIRSAATSQTKSAVKKGIWEFLIATWEIWVPALGIILGVGLLIGLVVIIPPAVCNSSVFDGVTTATAKSVFTASGLCSAFEGTTAQTIITNPQATPPTTGGLTDAVARRLLANANICNYPNGSSLVDCVNAAEPQTSLNGVQLVTLNEIIRFKADCDNWARTNGGGVCEVVVTGGTETTGGHAGGPCSHLSGNKVDIRPTTIISRYIRTFTPAGTRGTDPQYTNPLTGVNYVDEGNHWDIGGVGCS